MKKYDINLKKLLYVIIFPIVLTSLVEIYCYNFEPDGGITGAIIWGIISYLFGLFLACFGDISDFEYRIDKRNKNRRR